MLHFTIQVFHPEVSQLNALTFYDKLKNVHSIFWVVIILCCDSLSCFVVLKKTRVEIKGCMLYYQSLNYQKKCFISLPTCKWNKLLFCLYYKKCCMDFCRFCFCSSFQLHSKTSFCNEQNLPVHSSVMW